MSANARTGCSQQLKRVQEQGLQRPAKPLTMGSVVALETQMSEQ